MKDLCKVMILLLALILLPLSAMADEEIDTAEALQDYLAQCREENLSLFVISVPSSLGKELSADNNALLDQLMKQAGVESYEVRINRNTKLTFTQVVYGEILPEASLTVEDAKAAIAAFLPGKGQELTIVCGEDVFQYLFREGGIYRVLAELGVEDATVKGNTKGHIFLSNVQMMTVPYAQVASVSEAGEKIAAWREQKAPAFKLVFDMDVYETLTRDDYSLMAFLGGVDDYRLSYYYQTGVLYFTEVTYSDVPGVYCQSEEEVVAAIRAMGARGVTSFQLKLNEDTYNKVYEGYFSRLSELQGQAGMTDGDLRYSSVSRMLIFDNAVISADAKVLSALAEVTAHVEDCVQRGEKDISMLLTEDVYADLMAGVNFLFASDAKFYDLIANAGIFTADDISFNRHSGAISLYGVQCYAGTNILRALEAGDLSALTSREQQALSAAERMAAECTRSTPVETALAIHDALCALITYTDDEATTEDDCCIGALLDGRANCDGYADAMLLVGRLAGLNVRYQHGDSLKGGMGSYFSTHMWNLIELDGSWRMIDVTWDDTESEIFRTWFNIGEDRAALSHVWSKEMTVPMLSVTDTASRPVAEYFAANTDEITISAFAAQTAGHEVFDIYVAPECDIGVIGAREAAVKGLSGSIWYTWIDSLKCLHVRMGN